MAHNYEELGLIGRGAYGSVFRARDHLNGRMVALKRVKIATTEDGLPVSTIREISMLKLLDTAAHPNVVRLYDVFQTVPRQQERRECILTLVFEHVDQDLAQFIERHPPPGLPEHVIKDMMQQLIGAVYFLHVNRMVHRDLKPQNILVDNQGRIKVADFGLARIYSFCMVLTSVVVTLWYRAPEVLLQSTYATPVDMWSIGCIFAEMYNRRPLFPGRSDADQLNRIFAVIGAPLESEWPADVSLPRSAFEQYSTVDHSLWRYLVPDMCSEGRSLLRKLLEFSPNNRICASEALEHPYFQSISTSDSQDSGIMLSQEEAGSTMHEEETGSMVSQGEAGLMIPQEDDTVSVMSQDDGTGSVMSQGDGAGSIMSPEEPELRMSNQEAGRMPSQGEAGLMMSQEEPRVVLSREEARAVISQEETSIAMSQEEPITLSPDMDSTNNAATTTLETSNEVETVGEVSSSCDVSAHREDKPGVGISIKRKRPCDDDDYDEGYRSLSR